jgi:cytochrome c-type biogenesis protein CcmE
MISIKVVALVGIMLLAIVGLAYSSSINSAKSVVTVSSLIAAGKIADDVRVGARLSGADITVRLDPQPVTEFVVVDPANPTSGEIRVLYDHPAPDTLKPGRDVILEGSFDGQQFVASTLLTQCPSKYEPPVPGAESSK